MTAKRQKTVISDSESFDKLLRGLIKEEISKEQEEQIRNIQPNDWITVYHGTPLYRLPLLINGFDATQPFKRDYRAGKHPGLFVTADFDVAKGFGGGAIIELKVKAKNLHGTDYGGRTGREQERQGEDWSFVDGEFPNSFRPHMSDTMLREVEPQALLLGIVQKDQITRVWTRDFNTGEWQEFLPDEFLGSEKVYSSQYGIDKKFKKTGLSLSDPKMKLDEFITMFARVYNRPEERILKMLKLYADRGFDEFEDKLQRTHFGGSYLGPKAIEALYRQLV